MKKITYKQAKIAWLAKKGKYPISMLHGAALKLYQSTNFRQIKHLYNKGWQNKKNDDNGKYQKCYFWASTLLFRCSIKQPFLFNNRVIIRLILA